MTIDPLRELPPASRRLIFRAALRALLTTAVLAVLYYELPFRSWNGSTALRFLVGLLIFAGITVWQVRAIAGSRYPALKAAQALGLVFPLYLLVFASTYYVMEGASAANFSQPLTKTGALYFTVTVFSTVGFGDITRRSDSARIVAMVQMLGDLAVLGVGVRVLLGAVRRGRQRRTGTDDDVGSATGPDGM